MTTGIDIGHRTSAGRDDRPGGHPLRRRLGRRHAGDGRPVHRRERAVRQRPVDAAELPRRDPGPGRHPRRGLGLPGPHLRPRDPHARRRAERARGHEPGGARANVATCPRRHDRRQLRRLRRARLAKAGYADGPAHRRQPVGLSGLRDPDDVAHHRGVQADRRQAPRRRAEQELLRPRARLLALPPAGRRRRSTWIAERYAKAPIVVEANTLAFRAGFNFGETAELFESSYEIPPAEHLPGTYTNVTGNTALAWGLLAASELAKLPLFLGSYPITPASDILHELSKHKNFGVRTLPGRGRDRRHRCGARRGLRRRPRRHDDERPGARPQGRDDRAGRHARAAAAHRRHPAGRPVDGPADEDRAVRPAARHVRPPRRGARADRGGRRRPRTASRRRSRRRGSPSSTARRSSCSPTATSRTAPSRGGCRTWPTCRTSRPSSPPSRTPPTPSGAPTFWPYLRDAATARTALGGAGHAGPRAPHRRPREGRRDRHRRPTTRSTTRRWSTTGRPRSPASPRTSRPSRPTTPKADAPRRCCSGGGRPTRRSPPGCAACGRRGRSVAQVHLTHLNPFPPGLGEVLRAYDTVLVPEDEPRASQPARPGGLPRRREVAQPGPRTPVPGRRDRAGHPRRDRRTRRRQRAHGRLERLDRRGGRTMTDAIVPDHDPQGLGERPGGPLVPRMRGLLDPGRRPAAAARARGAAREHGVRLRHRLRRPIPVLHEHLRDALDPRPGPGDRDGSRRQPARPRRLGGLRRRRLALDRRQPPHPRAAAQREHHDPDVQQPDLRPDQGPVLADVRGRERSPSRPRSARSTRRSTRSAWRSAPRRASSPAPTTSTASTCWRSSAERTTTRARPSSRSTRTATSSTTAPSTRSPARSTAPTC